jgi:16S rRNA (adenine1518-N6/adenine1519-N6)-dimethyltransferase
VLAVEIDRGLALVLQEVVDGAGDVEIIREDALKIDFDALVAEKTAGEFGVGGKPYKLVANLPYYITSPLLMHLLTARSNISQMVVMVQYEVGARLAAVPGTKDYGVLSVAAQYFSQVSILFRLPGTVFYPSPTVDSAVVRLTVSPLAEPAVDEDVFFRIVRAAFAKRRKTLLNALTGSALGYNKEQWQSILKKADLDPMRRGETLSLAEFTKLASTL